MTDGWGLDAVDVALLITPEDHPQAEDLGLSQVTGWRT